MIRHRLAFRDRKEVYLLDEAIDRLHRADRSGLDQLDSEMAETVDLMVGWAHQAGWNRAGVNDVPSAGFRREWLPVTRSVLAAVVIIFFVGSLGMLAWRVVEDDIRFQPEHAQPDPGSRAPTVEPVSREHASLASGVCGRDPRTAAEIAQIVERPFTSRGNSLEVDTRPFSELKASLIQVTREWNACLINGQYDRAMAYESENYLRNMAAAGGSGIEADLTDRQVATIVADQHQALVPMAHGDGIEIVIYTINWTIGLEAVNAAEMWMVPVDPNGDWVEWPTVMTFVLEDGRWVIDLTDREGSLSTPVPDR